MGGLTPTPAVYDFLGDLHRNPALASRLLREMTLEDPKYRGRGVFIAALDGEPCVEIVSEPVSNYEQGELL